MLRTLLALLAALAVATAAYPDTSFAKQITSLPGVASMPSFDMYSGYITVNTTTGANLFFWFVQADVAEPDDAPVLVWLNGGPGCSSLDGLLSENGPFTLQLDGETMTENPYSWNKVANVLYLEAPPGVGFSYSLSGDYTYGDNSTAAGNAQAIHGFFKLFPKLADNALWITGESYAGHYVPQMAYALLDSGVNLAGTATGNPSWDFHPEANSYLTFMAQHQLVSQAQYAHAHDVCNGTFYPPPNDDCKWVVGNLTTDLLHYINPYDILALCLGGGPGHGGCFTQQMLMGSRQPLPGAPLGQTFVPCMDVSYEEKYLNSAAVKKALHVSNHSLDWNICSQVLTYNQFAPTMNPYYEALLAHGKKVLVYSGDIDSCVNTLGTEACIATLNFDVKTAWKPWLMQLQNLTQTAGYVTEYDVSHLSSDARMHFITIKGAGHMVPHYKPPQALEFITRFLAGDCC
eukprot:PLAT13398.1.p1 GENE.PLAT13398.1~~PLAT13398.1.p1  ORF type:complete len:472 (+),score=185.70 PLAT13398.1:38-1417(+)